MNVITRMGTRGTSAALAIAIVATIGAGTATAVTRGGGGTGVAEHDAANPLVAERAYLKQIEPVAGRIDRAVSPAEHVLDKIDTPRAGDAFSARDALAHGDGLAELTSAHAALGRVTAPAQLAHQRRTMLSGTASMIRAYKQLHALGSDTSLHLISRVDSIGARLTTAASRWRSALGAAYQVAHTSVPKRVGSVDMHTVFDRTAWIFNADRSCNATAFKLADADKYVMMHTLAGYEGFDRIWQHGLAFAGNRLTGLQDPKGRDALPRTLRSRLRVLSFTSKVFAKELNGLRGQSYSAVSAAQDQITNLLPSLRELGKEMRQYGAVNCGQIIGIWGGSKHLIPTSHHHGNLDT